MKAGMLLKGWLKAPTFSPAGFVVRAAALALIYGVLSTAGLRNYMSVLSLTFPEGSARSWASIACMAYLVSYFTWILGVPILLFAAGLMKIEAVLRRPTAASRPEGPRPP
jgi:hypothetical protein